MKSVLCVSLLLCLFGASFGQTAPGGFQDLNESTLNELYPKLQPVFENLKSQHDDFGLVLQHIVRGKSQVVAGTHYVIHAHAGETLTDSNPKHCDIDILENLKGEFDQVEVKCDHHDKTFRYTKQ